jgi:predicted lipid-binding transport protein (Tim44 family)
MYCSDCGSAVTRGLSYCNHCGATLSVANAERVPRQSGSPELLVPAMVLVFIFGLGAIIGLMFGMKMVGFNLGLIIAASLLSFMLMIGIEGVLISLLFSRKLGAKGASDAAQLKEKVTKELGAADARALHEPVPSVTEHTTRAFAPVYSERKPE